MKSYKSRRTRCQIFQTNLCFELHAEDRKGTNFSRESAARIVYLFYTVARRFTFSELFASFSHD